jgi:phosphoglycolate phosphatase
MKGSAPRPDGIVFDLDGTLWDTTETVAAAWDSAVRREHPGNPPVTRAAIAAVMGFSHARLVERLLPAFASAERERLAALCYAEEERRLRAAGGSLYPGVADGLAALARRHALFIVSNCQRGYIETFLDVTGLRGRFRDHECHGRTGQSKAENLAALIRRNRLAAPWFVGDTEGDEAAAQASGVPFLHAAYGFGAASRPIARCADFGAIVAACLDGVNDARAGATGQCAANARLPLARGRFPLPLDRGAVARDWRARGYSCELFVDPPGREWNGFVHPVNELVAVVEGRLRFETGRAAHTLEPGDELFIPAQAVHSVKNIHSGITRWLFGYDG